VGGFLVLARLKLASKSDQKKKVKRCGTAEGFLTVLVGYQGTSVGFFRAERGKSLVSILTECVNGLPVKNAREFHIVHPQKH